MSTVMLSREAAFLSMTSPLGQDVLVPARLHLEETLNRPFLGVLEVVSQRRQIDADALLHKPVCITLQRQGGKPRFLHGLVHAMRDLGPAEPLVPDLPDLRAWRLEVVPALWFLSQASDCRVFENKTAVEILRTLATENRLDIELPREARQRPLTVQYNETNLDFFTRLVEEEGWLFHFRHSHSGHKLVVADGSGFLQDVPGPPLAATADAPGERLLEWHVGRAIAHGRIAMGRYDPETSNVVAAGTSTKLPHAGRDGRDVFHWPAGSVQDGEIKAHTRRLIEAAEAAASLAEGASVHELLAAGLRLAVRGPQGTEKFVLVGVVHDAVDPSWHNSREPVSYGNRFTACPADLPWRPRPSVRRPRMDGIYSADVLGSGSDEIHTDELGRVKIRFRWDHRQTATSAGVWVRVMQGWAGPQMGWFALPRVGTEVAVAFIDGDPDRPVVVGQLHNRHDKPPLNLPAQKTRTGIRTRSTPNGDAQACSELWFDDHKGHEVVLLHAERDLEVETEHDATTTVGNARKATVRKGDDTVTIEHGNRTVSVPLGNHSITSDSGNISIKTNGGAIALEAMTSLTLKVGQSSITLDQAGVTIKGLMVKVEGQLLASLKGTLTKLDADALLQANGGILMLN